MTPHAHCWFPVAQTAWCLFVAIDFVVHFGVGFKNSAKALLNANDCVDEKWIAST